MIRKCRCKTSLTELCRALSNSYCCRMLSLTWRDIWEAQGHLFSATRSAKLGAPQGSANESLKHHYLFTGAHPPSGSATPSTSLSQYRCFPSAAASIQSSPCLANSRTTAFTILSPNPFTQNTPVILVIKTPQCASSNTACDIPHSTI